MTFMTRVLCAGGALLSLTGLATIALADGRDYKDGPVINVASKTSECMWTMKPGRDANGSAIHKEYRWLQAVRFVNGDKGRVLIGYSYPGQGYASGTVEYRCKTDGTWEAGTEFAGMLEQVGPGDLRLKVKEGPNDPPRVVASDPNTSRVIWDPNPQLANIKLGEVRIYTWKAQDGRPWRGGLYLPPDYKPGQRYPLVIQTHGFDESGFEPAGLFPTGLAAQALAGTGIVALQVADEGDARHVAETLLLIRVERDLQGVPLSVDVTAGIQRDRAAGCPAGRLCLRAH